MNSVFFKSKKKRVEYWLTRVSGFRLLTSVIIIICWFYPVITGKLIEILYPISLIPIGFFIFLLYRTSRLRDFKNYLEVRQSLSVRGHDQNQSQFDVPIVSAELEKWNMIKNHFYEKDGQHWDDLDLLGKNGLIRLIHWTLNMRSGLKLLSRFSRESLTIDQLEKRQKEVQVAMTGPRRKLLTLLKLYPEKEFSYQTIQSLLKLKLVEHTIWVWFVFFYYFIYWIGLVFWLLYAHQWSIYLLIGLFFLYPLINLKIYYRQTSQWVNSIGVELTRYKKIHPEMAFYSKKYKKKGLSRLNSWNEEVDVFISTTERIISALGLRQNIILYALVHAIFPWDIFWTQKAENLRQNRLSQWFVWQDELEEFEAILELAEWSQQSNKSSWPIWDADTVGLSAKNVRHPLIPLERVIGNDIFLGYNQNKCCLITGSNMSGKSTYLRAIASNLFLARSGAKVLANHWESSVLIPLTSLKRVDSLEESLSTFYSEVKTLKDLRSWSTEKECLYLIDEIFRGTNNRERLIGSERFIKYLIGTKSIGLVTTHDLELTKLADQNPKIINEHFEDQIVDGRMTFDYTKRSGPCPSTNALRVMEMEGVI